MRSCRSNDTVPTKASAKTIVNDQLASAIHARSAAIVKSRVLGWSVSLAHVIHGLSSSSDDRTACHTASACSGRVGSRVRRNVRSGSCARGIDQIRELFGGYRDRVGNRRGERKGVGGGGVFFGFLGPRRGIHV